MVKTYKLLENGGVEITVKVIPTPKLLKAKKAGLSSLPRVGVELELDSDLFNVSYVGLGPHENYPDRKSCCDTGKFATTVSDMHTPYIVPSENGARGECDSVTFSSEGGGKSLKVSGKGGQKFSFSASLWSNKELQVADHTYDLAKRGDGGGSMFVNIDHKIMGVGGDCSWLPVVYEDYKVGVEVYEFGFVFQPL